MIFAQFMDEAKQRLNKEYSDVKPILSMYEQRNRDIEENKRQFYELVSPMNVTMVSDSGNANDQSKKDSRNKAKGRMAFNSSSGSPVRPCERKKSSGPLLNEQPAPKVFA